MIAFDVKRIRVQGMECPIGINKAVIKISWQLVSDEKNTRQTAFCIRLFTDETKRQCIWECKKEDTTDVWYVLDVGQGVRLSSRTRYYFDIQVWDNHGGQATSRLSWFETGIDKMEWKARWIEPVQEPVPLERYALEKPPTAAEDIDENFHLFGIKKQDRDYKEFHPCQYLRKGFNVDKPVRKARLYATAHGLYRFFINGRRIGDDALAPEFTSYQFILLVRTYDVTDMLKTGENALGAVLADGWWAGRIGGSGESCQYGNLLGVLFQLEIEYMDGTMETVISDQTVRSSDHGPLRYSDIFVGEKYDARLEMNDFSRCPFSDTDWPFAAAADYGYDNLENQSFMPVRTVKEITPKRILITPNGDRVLDLGQVIAGRIRMKLAGPRGITVSLEHSEVLNEKGNFFNNIEGVNKDQQDFYTLSGDGIEQYEPWFTFHGFRYVRIKDYPGSLSVENFTGIVLSTDLEGRGSFLCSDEKINRLQQNIWWSLISNAFSIPMDCPQRERAGWSGDIAVFAQTACYLRDMEFFLQNWMDNLRAEQLPDGQVPNLIPYIEPYKRRFVTRGINQSSCGWGDAVLSVPWALYMAYGDKQVLKDNYEAMKKWMHYVQYTAEHELIEGAENFPPERLARQKYLWNTGFHYGDWCIPSVSIKADGNVTGMLRSAFLTMEIVAACYYAYNTNMMCKIACALGLGNDEANYRDLNGKIRSAFALEYFDEEGHLPVHFQGMYVLALQMKLVPEHLMDKVLNQLLDLILINGNCLDTGFLSVQFLLDVLTGCGRKDIAYQLLFQTKCPSWLYEVDKGATTIWEAWQAIMPDGKVTNASYNHYAFGAVGSWIYREIGGLQPIDPGYRHVCINPGMDSGLSSAETSYLSPYGLYSVQWLKNSDGGTLKAIVPPCCTAEVVLPAAILAKTFENGKSISTELPGIRAVAETAAGVQITVDSGMYEFSF